MQRIGVLALLFCAAWAGQNPPPADSCDVVKKGCMPNAPAAWTHGTNTVADCCNKCQQYSGCRVWQYVGDTPEHPCTLFFRAGEVQPGNCSYGEMRPTPPAPKPQPTPSGAKNVLMIVVRSINYPDHCSQDSLASLPPSLPTRLTICDQS